MGEGGYETLILAANSMTKIYNKYHSWLDQLSVNGRASMDIEAIKVQANDANDGDLSWLKAMFPNADLSWKNHTNQISKLFNMPNNDDVLRYASAYAKNNADTQNGHGPRQKLEQEYEQVHEHGYKQDSGHGAQTRAETHADMDDLKTITLHEINDMLHGFDIIDLRNSEESLTIDSLLSELRLENPLSLSSIEVKYGNSNLPEKLSEGSVLRVHADENGKVNLNGHGWNAASSKVGSVAFDGFEYEVYQNDVNNDQFILIQANMLVC